MSSRSPHRHPNQVTDADLTKLIEDHPKLREHLAKKPRIVETRDVPDTGGYSTDGTDDVFIDRHLAKARPEIDGHPYEEWRHCLADHEWMEKGCVQILGMPYHGSKQAHAYATAYENRSVTAIGLTPYRYNKALKPFIKRDYLERITVPPRTLDCEPYRGSDPGDRKIMAHFAELGVVDAAEARAPATPTLQIPKFNDAGIISEIKALRGELGGFVSAIDRLCSAVAELSKQKAPPVVVMPHRPARTKIRLGSDSSGALIAIAEHEAKQ